MMMMMYHFVIFNNFLQWNDHGSWKKTNKTLFFRWPKDPELVQLNLQTDLLLAVIAIIITRPTNIIPALTTRKDVIMLKGIWS